MVTFPSLSMVSFDLPQVMEKLSTTVMLKLLPTSTVLLSPTSSNWASPTAVFMAPPTVMVYPAPMVSSLATPIVSALLTGPVVFDKDVVVFLSLEIDLLGAFFVLEAEFVVVVGAALGIAAGFDDRAGFVVFQVVEGFVLPVVDASDKDRPVRVAVLEIYQYLVADAGYEHRPPSSAAPCLEYPDPAGALFVISAFSVPRKLDFDPAEFVNVDFLAFRSDDYCALGAVDNRFSEGFIRAKGYGCGNYKEFVCITGITTYSGIFSSYMRL